MNSRKDLYEKSKSVKQRYATRKLKVGMVSVLVGFTFIFGGNNVIKPLTNTLFLASAETQNLSNSRSVRDTSTPIGVNTRDNHYNYRDDSEYIEENSYIGFDTSSQVFSANKEVNEKTTNVEKVGEEVDGRQKWKITYNAEKIHTSNNGDVYTANPRFAFTLSKNLEIDGNVKFKLYDGNWRLVAEENNATSRPSPNSGGYLLYNDYAAIEKWSRYDGQEAKNHFDNRHQYNMEAYHMTRSGNGGMKFVPPEAQQKRAKMYNSIDKLFYFQTWTGRNDWNKAAKVVVEFTTYDKSIQKKGVYNAFNYDNKDYIDSTYKKVGWMDSGVNAVYMSYDYSATYWRSESILKPINIQEDTDNDGLLDFVETYVGTNLYNADTDGDALLDNGGTDRRKIDVGEVTNDKPYSIDGTYSFSGTDPIVAPAKVSSDKILGKVGEVIAGKVAPKTTVALVSVNEAGGDVVVLGESVADADGNYSLTIGKKLSRLQQGSLNKYHNNIKFTDESNIKSYETEDIGGLKTSNAQAYDSATDSFRKDGRSLKLQLWSDGTDERPRFATPETSKDSFVLVDNVLNKYEALTPSKTAVININDVSEGEKQKIKEKLMANISDGKHTKLFNDLKNGINSITVNNDGTATIETKNGEGFDLNIPSSVLVREIKAPVLSRNSEKDAEKGIDENTVVVENIDEAARTFSLMGADKLTPISSFEKTDEGNWNSSNKDFSVKVYEEKLYIIPNDAGMDTLDDEASRKIESSGAKGIQVIEFITKDAAPNSKNSNLLEYKSQRPVMEAPSIKTTNKENPNIIIRNIAKNADKITINIGSESVEITRNDEDKENNRWSLGTASNYFQADGKYVNVQNGTITLYPKSEKKESLEGQNVSATATNTSYVGNENNNKTSNTVVYDTTIKKPISVEAAYDDTSVTVKLPDDVTVGDKVTVQRGSVEKTISLSDEQVQNKTVSVDFNTTIKAREEISSFITDKVGNVSEAVSINAPDPLDSENITELKQKDKNTLTAKVPKDAVEGSVVKVVDNSGKEIYDTEATIDSEGVVTVRIPNGLNGKEVKLSFKQPHRVPSTTELITVDQSIESLSITEAVSNTNTIKVKLADDVKVGDKYLIKIADGDNLAEGEFSQEDINSKSKTIELNKNLPNKSQVVATITDGFGNSASTTAFVTTKVNTELLDKAISDSDEIMKNENEKNYKYANATNKEEFEDALSKAKELKTKLSGADANSISQNYINDATERLNNAYNALNGDPTVDKRDLVKAINRAKDVLEKLNSMRLPVNSKNDLRDKLDALIKSGESINNNSKNQDEINNAKDSLNNISDIVEAKDSLMKKVFELIPKKNTPKYFNASDTTTFDNTLGQSLNILQIKEVNLDTIKEQEKKLIKAFNDLDGVETDSVELENSINGVTNPNKTEDSSYYNASPELKANFDNALANANKVLQDAKEDGSKVTQSQVNEANSVLTKAIEALNGTPTNTTELDKLIEKAQGLIDNNEPLYKNSKTKDNFNVVLEEAKNKKSESPLTQVTVDKEVSKLKDAILALDGKSVGKEELRNEISGANEDKLLAKYYNADDTIKSNLEDALRNAKSVESNSEATQQQVDDAKNALKEAREALTGADTNKEELNEAIVNANTAKNSEKYTFASKELQDNLNKAIGEAEYIKNNSNATQKEVDDAVVKLNNAKDALNGAASHDEIKASISKAKEESLVEGIPAEKETELKSALENALREAEFVDSKEDAISKELADAKEKLDQAIKNIEEAKKNAKEKQKEEAKKAKDLTDSKNKAKEDINNNPNLTEKQKKDLTDKVENAEDTAKVVEITTEAGNIADENLEEAKANLEKALKDAKDVKETEKYSLDSKGDKDSLTEAIGSGEFVKSKKDANLTDIKNATEKLTTAIGNIDGKPSVTSLEKSLEKVSQAEQDATGLDNETELKEALEIAKTEAEEAKTKAETAGAITQAEVDAAKTKLDEAIKAIEDAKTSKEEKEKQTESERAKAEEINNFKKEVEANPKLTTSQKEAIRNTAETNLEKAKTDLLDALTNTSFEKGEPLSYEEANKSDLESSINKANEEGLTENMPEGTEDLKTKLEEAKTKAEEVKNNPYATEEEVKEAKDNLDKAVQAIKDAKVADEKAKEEVKAQNEKELSDAKEEAKKAVNDNPNLTTEEKEALTNKIDAEETDDVTKVGKVKTEAEEKATANLNASKEKLEEALRNAEEAKETEKYTLEKDQTKKDTLNEAIGVGKVVKVDDTATVDEIKNATKKIKDAIEALSGKADLTGLEASKTKADSTNIEGVETEKKDELEQNLEDAKRTYEEVKSKGDAATQSEVDAAKTKLDEAIKAIEDSKTSKEEKEKQTESERAKAEEINNFKKEVEANPKLTTSQKEAIKNTAETNLEKAKTDLLDALTNTSFEKGEPLSYEEANKSDLESSINKANEEGLTENMPEGTEDLKTKLEEAKTKAEEVKNNPYATEEEVKEAKDNLDKAVQAIKDAKVADEKAKELQDAKDKAKEEIKNSDLSEDEKKQANKAIEDATTTDEVEKAKQNALSKGTQTEQLPSTDKLDKSIEEAKKTAENLKEDETVDAGKKKDLEDAIKEAEKVKENLGSDQEAIDNAQKKVDEAKKALEDGKKAIDEINPTTGENNPGEGNSGAISHGGGSSSNRPSGSSGNIYVPSTGSTGGSSANAYKPGDNTTYETVTVSRESGSNRFETAANIAKKSYPNGAKTVVLVHTDKYTDALAAIPYAKVINAPILYVGTDKTPEETLKALKELGTENLIIIGGENSISNGQNRSLGALGYNTSRIGGRDRYETAQLIAEKLAKISKLNSRDVIIASGEDFPDAITISSVAIKDETPILLSSKDTLSKYTIKGLQNLSKDRVIVVGGLNSISANVENQLKPYTKQTITRFAGLDRYETSAIIASKLRPNSTVSVFANGEKYQDAMVSGGMLNNYDAPLLLVKRNSVPNSVEEYMRNSKVKKSIIVGGENSVSKEVEDRLRKLEKK